MAAGEKVAVPAQHRVRTHRQPHSAEHVRGEPVQQRCQKGPVTRG